MLARNVDPYMPQMSATSTDQLDDMIEQDDMLQSAFLVANQQAQTGFQQDLTRLSQHMAANSGSAASSTKITSRTSSYSPPRPQPFRRRVAPYAALDNLFMEQQGSSPVSMENLTITTSQDSNQTLLDRPVHQQ